MKVIDFIKACRGNVKFILDGQGPALNKTDFVKLCYPSREIEMEIACVTMDIDSYGDVLCEISTIYEECDQCGSC